TFEPFMRAAVDAFGPSRTIWGGNWPVCTINGSLARWVAATRAFLSSCAPRDRSEILSGTAGRVYRLS
ncbi:MAG: amidohydrolase family protein, partial [Planctomycetota bacterium]|nr:amidohydrolase family protein [Planctomycetota bacterium]